VSGADPQEAEANGALTLTLAGILDHEVIAIDL
jgi:hypothetical protein